MIYCESDADENRMKLFSQSAGYALRALTFLSDGHERSLTKEVAEGTQIPAAYLAKIMRQLGQAGIVKSKRGHRGGIQLSRPAQEISLLEIGVAMDGAAFQDECMLGLGKCSDAQACPTHEFWKEFRAKARANLDRITLADVVAYQAHYPDRRVGVGEGLRAESLAEWFSMRSKPPES